MGDIQERKKKRFLFLNKLHEITNGNEYCGVFPRELGAELGFSQEDSDTVVQYLEGEGLVTDISASTIGITHFGIQQVEDALEHPDNATQYFPPVNIIQVQNMYGSQIQQGSHNSTLTHTYSSDNTQNLHAFVQQFKAQLEQIPFGPADRAEASAELDTMHAQLLSPKPKHVVINQSLLTLRALLEGVAGNLIASDLMQHLHLFMK